MEEEIKWFNSEFASWVGQGIFIFCLCVGVATCQLCDKAEFKVNINQTDEKVIKTEQ
jgi:hypothetical protein